ncbi:MAG: hypothetical protein CHACPFDD_03274 [Phycisphaerae bacterium]|nr:hypothetical protein [Phycisphaerae bacterium]
MRELAENLRIFERRVTEEKGPFVLFALFLRENAPNRWDLVVSAPWIDTDEYAALEYLSDKLRTHLTEPELVAISRIAPVPSTDPRLSDVQRALNCSHAIVEVRNCEFFGLAIAHAFIITSRKAKPRRASPRPRRRSRAVASRRK